MANNWDPIRVKVPVRVGYHAIAAGLTRVSKAQLRLTAQRLGQLQDRKDSIAQITSKDIATLLRQRDVSLARTKAQNLMKEDTVSNAMEILEMYCGVILEWFADLEKDELRLHPATIEAIASIIYAAAFTESQDLNLVRDMLILRVGPSFAQSAMHNSEGHVSQRILRCIHWKPSAADTDEYLQKIARKSGVDWKPQMRSEEKIAMLSEILDASDIMGVVDMQKLKLVASFAYGSIMASAKSLEIAIRNNPGDKNTLGSRGTEETGKLLREDLIRRLLNNISSLPPPVSPPSVLDKSLLDLIESLARVPDYLYHGLEDEVEPSSICPVHGSASADIRINFAFSLDERLQLLQIESSADKEKDEFFCSTPEIRLDYGSAPSSPQDETFDLSKAGHNQQPAQKTLSMSNQLTPKVFRSIAAHPSHVSSLLRLLYVHKALIPGMESPHIASLLVPLYAVMNQEADPAELAHAEADAFWLFEALVREVSELQETEGGLMWMKKFSERLSMADSELLEDLTLKGLDPGLPQYSYLCFVHDSFGYIRLGKNGRKSPSLWDVDGSAMERQQLKPWELGDAFMEGMAFLQRYPIEEAGGIERVLQVASDILMQREELTRQPQSGNISLSAKIRETVFRGFINQAPSTEDSSEDSEEEEEDDTQTNIEANHDHEKSADGVVSSTSAASGWASYLRSTVIRGITNQSAMDEPPSPSSLTSSPSLSPSQLPSRQPSPLLTISSSLSPIPEQEGQSHAHLSPPSTGSGLWGYAEKLKQSDMAAKISKVSTNFSAKALDAWTARSAPAHDISMSGKQSGVQPIRNPNDLGMAGSSIEGQRRSSLPDMNRSQVYAPPPRPAFFKPPRDTRIFTPDELSSLVIPTSSESTNSTLSTPPSHSRVQSLTAVIPSLSGLLPAATPTRKSGPRPLLLRASQTVTAPPMSNRISRSMNNTPTPQNNQWSDVLRSKRQSSSQRRDSQFSQSSTLSQQSNPVGSPQTGKNGWESDTSISRVVPLNRASVSPVVSAFRASRMSRTTSASSQSEFGVLNSRTLSESSPRGSNMRLYSEDVRGNRVWERTAPIPDSPSTGPSSPPPRTPVTNVGAAQASVRITIPEQQRGSAVLSETAFPTLEPVPDSKKSHRKASTSTSLELVGDTSDSSIPPSPLSRTVPRVRSKRYGSQTNSSSLRERESPAAQSPAVSIPSPNSLAAPDPESEFEIATTPKASHFPSMSPTDTQARSPRRRKISMEAQERRRKLSGESGSVRTRKVSGESKTARTRKISADGANKRDSTAADGDDEGYDELLSAYESEEGSKDDHTGSSEA
ncbi:hypothetical protein EW145_g4782 [Phellinidium pouzarii]|uniref:Uncharacterized protein n=1 Tax=Phellinidium pouzarii TaxID=167371 RepID=A0A4S4L2H2_9AGAM|nr:hypothetical protein EW145_g4782 [Phellinidium pouzarii]